MINKTSKSRIAVLSAQYLALARSLPEAVREIALAEVPEIVYNSNAIENSTLTLRDTEDILFRNSIKKDHDIREIYEAINLAKITTTLLDNSNQPISVKSILKLHQLLLTGISDNWAGRFRTGKEWVRVGAHVGANPDFVERLVTELVIEYDSKRNDYFLENIAWFHAEFETIHPFNDGNGRLGRVIINQQLMALGLPPITIQNKNKHTSYYPSFDLYRIDGKCDQFVEMFASLLVESLHKRITLMTSPKIITVSAWAKANNLAGNVANNRAIRGTIPAFRMREKWMIASEYKL
jgi:Fic family protein